MISIILENRKDEEIARTCRIGNEAYLVRDDGFDLLGIISEVEYDVFSSDDMPRLIQELETIKATLEGEEKVRHLDEIIALAERCRSDGELVLTFTPFE